MVSLDSLVFLTMLIAAGATDSNTSSVPGGSKSPTCAITPNQECVAESRETNSMLQRLQSSSQAPHPLWLRERCLDDWYVDSNSKQPIYGLQDEVEGLTVWSITPLNDCSREPAVKVVFSDGQACCITVKLLAAEMGSENNHGVLLQTTKGRKVVEPNYWDSSLISPAVFRHEDLVNETHLNTPAATGPSVRLLANLLSTGIALVEGVPQKKGWCTKYSNILSTPRVTEWGATFNVMTVPDVQGGVEKHDLAYSDKAIGLHTDNTYRDDPPDYQLLHAIEHCTPGDHCFVHNTFSDGFAVARKMYEEDPEAFQLLSETILRWENNGGDDQSSLVNFAPIIEIHKLQPGTSQVDSSAGKTPCPRLKAINFSTKSGGYAPMLPGKTLEAFYAAKRKYAQMIHSAEYIIKLQLFPGALVIFNNRRVLHSRSQILPSDGVRVLEGCYMNQDGVEYNYERLSRLFWADPDTANRPWRSLKEANKEDYEHMGVVYDKRVTEETYTTFINLLKAQRGHGAHLGQNLDLYEHGLQTASRALRAGEDAEMVVVSLLHDVFETTVAKNHGELAAAMLAPWVSLKSQWMLAHHEVFQGYYYYGHFGGNQEQRQMFRESPFFNHTAEWCEKYDQASFDMNYPSLPLSAFEPVLREVLAKPQYWWNPNHPKAGAITGVVDDPKVVAGGETAPIKPNPKCRDTWNCYA